MASAPGPGIEKLIDFFVSNDGTAYYQVKWKTTWERADVIASYAELVDSFWKFVNNADSSNIYHNRAKLQKPDPVIPAAIQNPPSMQHQQSQHTPTRLPAPQRKPSGPTSQRSQSESTPPQKRPSKPKTILQRTPSAPTLPSLHSPMNLSAQPNQAGPNQTIQSQKKSTLIIDSDDESDTMQTLDANTFQLGIQNIPSNQPNTQSPYSYPQHPVSTQWGGNVKTEPIDQKPFSQSHNIQQQQQQQPQQQQQQNYTFNPNQMSPAANQYQFNVQSPPMGQSPRGRGTSSRSRGGGVTSRGRGGRGGGPSPAKRKLGMPIVGSPTSKQMFGELKSESSEDMEIKTEQQTDESSSENEKTMNWKQYFEPVDGKPVDGKKGSSSYKCKVCGSIIAQVSNCARHFKRHSSDSGEHECPICGKNFHRVDYLERHLKQHGQGNPEEMKRMIKLISAGMKRK